MAAIEMKEVIEEYKQSLSEEREFFKIKLNGVGLHCGNGLIIDK